MLVYRSLESGRWRLWQWPRDQLFPSLIEAAEDVSGAPFVSPDGAWVAFDRGGTLFRVPLGGGNALEVAPLPFRTSGGSWGADGTLLVALQDGGLGRVQATGGEIAIVATPPEGRTFWYPQLLPGGQAALVTGSQGRSIGDLQWVDLESGSVETVLTNAVAGTYTPSGHLVFLRGGDLWTTAFELETRTVVGQPVHVASGIRVEEGGAVQLAVAQDGTVVYLTEGTVAASPSQLVWVDQTGAEMLLDEAVRAYRSPHVSPDGMRIAIEIDGDIWIWDGPGRLDRLTLDEADDNTPIVAGWGAGSGVPE
jgi:sugar lactone lactonase YvrE